MTDLSDSTDDSGNGDSIAGLHGAASAEGTFEEPCVSETPAIVDATGHNRLLDGPLRSTVFFLALPVLLEQFLNFCVGTWDIWLSGHLPDVSQTTPATAAVGVASYVGWLASMLFSLVGAGTTALVARHWGAGERSAANHIANQSLALASVAGLGFLAFIWPAAPLFARGLDLDPTAAAITIDYLRLDGIGLVFTAVSLVGAAALRGSGDTRTPMFVLGTVSVVNLIVSPLLVYGLGPVPSFGVEGIVWGTVTARAAGGVLMLVWLASGRSGLQLIRSELSIRRREARRIFRIGVPAAADGLIMWAAHYAFLRIISSAGPTAFAAHMVGIRLEAITYLPAVAWGAAAATMVGQSLGNQDSERARRSGHESVLQCSLLGVVITAVFYFGADWLFALMHTDAEVASVGGKAFPIVALLQIPLMVAIIYVASLRGAGETRFPLVMTLVSTLALRLPLAWWLCTHLEWGLYGAWVAMSVDMGVRGVMARWRFLSGSWERIEV